MRFLDTFSRIDSDSPIFEPDPFFTEHGVYNVLYRQ